MRFLLPIAALALTASAPAPPGTSLPLHVGGRAIHDTDGGQSFGWPGVYFEARFRGPAVRIVLDAPAEHMRLLVDGREQRSFRSPGRDFFTGCWSFWKKQRARFMP